MIQTDRPSCLECGGLMEAAIPWRCPRCECAALRARVAELEGEVAALRARAEAAEREVARLREVIGGCLGGLMEPEVENALKAALGGGREGAK